MLSKFLIPFKCLNLLLRQIVAKAFFFSASNNKKIGIENNDYNSIHNSISFTMNKPFMEVEGRCS